MAGGASGLGAAIVRLLHAEGAHVVVADRDEERGRAVVAELAERARFVATDITQPEPVAAATDAATDAPGGLRIAVTTAGIGWAERIRGRSGPHDLDHFESVLRINLVGTFNVLRLAAAQMAENKPGEDDERGVIVNSASIAAFEGQIGQSAYAASKAGVVALTLPAARELASVGVRVCTIAPGLFDTPLLAGLPQPAREALAQTIPFPQRLGRPEEFAQLVAAIVANPMLNGETLRLDGALRMPPR